MDKPSKNKPAAGRYALLDELRGLDLLSMIGYHACWDLIFLFGMSATWYTGWQGHLWQQSICWVFILLSGFCLPLGHRPLRRGLIVSGAGVLVTAVTLLFMPEDRVVFGVLTLLGAAMLITGLLQPLLQKIPAWAGLVVSLLLFAATYHTQDGFWQLGPWQMLLPGAWVCQPLYGLLRLFPAWLFLHGLLSAAALAVFVLGRVLPAFLHGAGPHGAAAPVGLCAAGLAGPTLAGNLSAASAGDLWGIAASVPCF